MKLLVSGVAGWWQRWLETVRDGPLADWLRTESGFVIWREDPKDRGLRRTSAGGGSQTGGNACLLRDLLGPTGKALWTADDEPDVLAARFPRDLA